MDDLISRKAAIDAVTKYCLKYDLRELLADIECLPTADSSEYCDKLWKIAYERGKRDAQPIRCDECKYWNIEWIPADGEGHYCPMMDQVMDGDNWCSYAERRSDG